MSDLRYPLHWPPGRPRTSADDRARARYGTRGEVWGINPLTVNQACDRLWAEVKAWDGRIDADDMVISTNLTLRQDGWPRSRQAEPTDPGAVFYCTIDGEAKAIECDGWDRVADNIAAIAGWLCDQRSAERRRVGSSRQTFMGYAALPAASISNTWYIELGFSKMPTTQAELRQAWRSLAKLHHPDHGGDRQAWEKLNIAYKQGLDALGECDES